jgi:hypothetical protein
MKRLAIYLALFTGCFGPTFAVLAATPPHDMQDAFNYACNLMEYDCADLPPPKIVWRELYNTRGIVGGYDGSDSIWMDTVVLRFADPVFTQSILAHEITHYLDVQLGVTVLPYTKQSVCESEMRAWRVGNAYVLTHGRADLVNYGWHIYYGCFQ